MGEQKNPISSIYKAKRKIEKKRRKIPSEKKKKSRYVRKKKGAIYRDRCGGEGGLERDMVEKKNTGKLIVKYEIVLQRGRY